VEPEPPPITIVDPNLSGGPDLITSGDERDPWRPTRRQRRIALVALAVVAVVTGATGIVGNVRAARSADQAAVASLHLAAVDGPDDLEPQGSVLVLVRNDGPHQVRLLSARLLAPGYAEQQLHEVIGPIGAVLIQLPDTAVCGPALLREPAELIRLRLRTYRGQVITRDVRLGPGAHRAVNHAARERCGYLPADEAFGFGVQSVERRGKQVVIRALVHDDSVLPLVLMRLAPAPGLEIEVWPRLPLQLPVQTSAQRITHFVELTLRVTVSGCPSFFSDPSSSTRVDLGTFVRGWVSRDPDVYEVPIPLVEPEVSGYPTVPDALLGLLEKSCSGIVIY
jgi:hypothetical protein